MGRIRRHLTYANVMATIAVFLVLGGGTAVALNGANTVQSDDLGPGAQVKAPDIANNAVNSPDILNSGIGYADLSRGAQGARAYGRVARDGTLSRSKNVASVINPQEGVYCITLANIINPASAVLIAAPDNGNDGTNTVTDSITVAEWDSSANCGPQSMAVRTFVDLQDATDNNNGFGNLPGDDLFPGDEGFAFVVP